MSPPRLRWLKARPRDSSTGTPTYLPGGSSHKDGIDTRQATLEALGKPSCIPCTEAQAAVFQQGRQARKHTNRVLGIPGYAAITSVPITLAVLAAIPLNVYTKDGTVTILHSTMLAAFFSCFGVLIANVLGMMFTGTFPNASSSSANAEQNALAELQVRFNDLGYFLLMQSRDPDKLQEITELALRINRDTLVANLARLTTQSEQRVENVFRFLCNVVEWLSSGSTCNDSYLESWIMMHLQSSARIGSPTLMEPPTHCNLRISLSTSSTSYYSH
eukprot:GGOE01018635.1.p1 GENE.GGOE01018635.1~~GGOE01018635.1.p1  ORF type:complete len:274 (+),score=47.38 GGOE01018635.1:46-867(+)